MPYRHYNPNPCGSRVGDCTVRALCAATGDEWEETYIALCLEGMCRGDMPSANQVWGAYLRSKGFRRHAMPDSCPDCYTVADFAREHPRGLYVLAIGGHVVTVRDGEWMDSWDSGGEVPAYYWVKEGE